MKKVFQVVRDAAEPETQEKTVSPSTSPQDVTPDEGKLLSKVTVNAVTAAIDANIQAGNIKSGVTILGVVGTRQQPTLFAPVVTTGTNTVSWDNDSRNGGFSVTLSATIDGVTVTSPLTVTKQLDGKTLTITASASNFESAVTTVSLSYEAEFIGSSWQMNSTITDNTYSSNSPYDVQTYFPSYNLTENSLAIGTYGEEREPFIQFRGIDTTVYYYSAYGWYTRPTGGGDRTIIPAPIVQIIDCNDGRINDLKAWFMMNGTLIE